MPVKRVNVFTVSSGTTFPVPTSGAVNIIYDINTNTLSAITGSSGTATLISGGSSGTGGTASSTSSIRDNYTATTYPTVNDDSADGYTTGSTWYYNGFFFRMTKDAVGAAEWLPNGVSGNNYVRGYHFYRDSSRRQEFLDQNPFLLFDGMRTTLENEYDITDFQGALDGTIQKMLECNLDSSSPDGESYVYLTHGGVNKVTYMDLRNNTGGTITMTGSPTQLVNVSNLGSNPYIYVMEGSAAAKGLSVIDPTTKTKISTFLLTNGTGTSQSLTSSEDGKVFALRNTSTGSTVYMVDTTLAHAVNTTYSLPTGFTYSKIVSYYAPDTITYLAALGRANTNATTSTGKIVIIDTVNNITTEYTSGIDPADITILPIYQYIDLDESPIICVANRAANTITIINAINQTSDTLSLDFSPKLLYYYNNGELHDNNYGLMIVGDNKTILYNVEFQFYEPQIYYTIINPTELIATGDSVKIIRNTTSFSIVNTVENFSSYATMNNSTGVILSRGYLLMANSGTLLKAVRKVSNETFKYNNDLSQLKWEKQVPTSLVQSRSFEKIIGTMSQNQNYFINHDLGEKYVFVKAWDRALNREISLITNYISEYSVQISHSASTTYTDVRVKVYK